MKTFDLTAFDKHRQRPYPAEKYLTDAELAAEHWSACTLWFACVWDDDGCGATIREHQRQAEIIARFATHPHAAEGGYL